MSCLEHYAGQDEIGLRYNSHRTKREEYLVMSLWKGSPGMWRIRGSVW
ncbi:putative orf33 protein [Escherichia coli 2-222-05_S4_C2]|nr:putative orf33 protein [Escherichia coli 2-222-05_S4_C2]KDX87432.1 putative orf33 protein [Escherichia coli 2-222-05_S4_C2]KDX89143.1 putative orf33 protein [Escherichia coli 2-222-05_S4_C2]KEO06332.1 putative orf33 protein [Escherichia coli 2-222-05_S4_C3]